MNIEPIRTVMYESSSQEAVRASPNIRFVAKLVMDAFEVRNERLDARATLNWRIANVRRN